MGIQEYFQEATGKGASDLFIVAGLQSERLLFSKEGNFHAKESNLFTKKEGDVKKLD